MKKTILAAGIAYLLMGVLEASAARPSANDNKQLRQLCNETTKTRLPNGTYRANPEQANRCYAINIERLEPTQIVVDAGKVYKEYQSSTPERTVTKSTYKRKMVKVNGVYTSVSTIEREKRFEHQTRVIMEE